MWIAITLSALAMTAIVAGRYLASSGIFAAITNRVRPGYHAGLGSQIRKEIGWSLVSALALLCRCLRCWACGCVT